MCATSPAYRGLWATSPIPGRRAGSAAGLALVELEEALVGLGHPVVIVGGQQVEEQATDDGQAEPGVGARGRLAAAGLDDGRGERHDPALDGAVQELIIAQASEQGLYVELEEEPLGRP